MQTDPKRKIVFIDDEPWALLGIQSVIPWEKYGFSCAGAFQSAEDALAFMRSAPVDAVITDIRLTGISGLELTQLIFSEKLARQVVVVSAYRDFEYAKQAMNAGAIHYLLKPLEADEVEKAAEKLADSLKNDDKAAPLLKLDENGNINDKSLLLPLKKHKNCYLSLGKIDNLPDGCVCLSVSVPGDSDALLISSAQPVLCCAAGISRCHENPEDIVLMFQEAELSSRFSFPYADHTLVSSIQFHIASNYQEKLYNSDLAGKFFISEVYMSELFKRYCKMSVGEFIIHVRLQAAMELLRISSDSIEEIAAKVGYSDPGYFSRLFRKKIGMTPREYRENARNNR